MERNPRIYVAGHRGMVGSAIRRGLIEKGYAPPITRDRADLDLTRQAAVEAFFDEIRPDYVFLAAAKVGGIWANATRPAEFIHANLAIQTHVIHAAHRAGVKRLIFLGSSCIYPKHAPQPLCEEHLLTGPLEPTNSAYAVAKIAGIEMCSAYARQYGDRYLPVMPTNLYGPEDSFDLEDSHVLPALIRKCHLARLAAAGDWEAIGRDEARFGPIPDDFRAACLSISKDRGVDHPPIPPDTELPPPALLLWGTGTPRREFLHVDDLADACIHLMETHDGTDLVNIGTGKDITIRELAETVKEVVGFDGGVIFDPARPDGTPRKLLDVSRLADLGWRASIGLTEGIRRTYAWYRDRG